MGRARTRLGRQVTSKRPPRTHPPQTLPRRFSAPESRLVRLLASRLHGTRAGRWLLADQHTFTMAAGVFLAVAAVATMLGAFSSALVLLTFAVVLLALALS